MPKGKPFIDDTPCPRCESTRLVRRQYVTDADDAMTVLPWRERWRLGRMRRVLIKSYVCEMCGHKWHAVEPAPHE